MMYSMKFRKNIQMVKTVLQLNLYQRTVTTCAGGVIEARITNDDLKCVKITADYNDNGTLKNMDTEKISIEDIKQTENTSSHKRVLLGIDGQYETDNY